MITRTTTTYDPVKLHSRKTFSCTICGKRGVRSKTFRQTVNPFNKNAQGQPKAHIEIWAELESQATAWQRQPDTHAGCER